MKRVLVAGLVVVWLVVIGVLALVVKGLWRVVGGREEE